MAGLLSKFWGFLGFEGNNESRVAAPKTPVTVCLQTICEVTLKKLIFVRSSDLTIHVVEWNETEAKFVEHICDCEIFSEDVRQDCLDLVEKNQHDEKEDIREAQELRDRKAKELGEEEEDSDEEDEEESDGSGSDDSDSEESGSEVSDSDGSESDGAVSDEEDEEVSDDAASEDGSMSDGSESGEDEEEEESGSEVADSEGSESIGEVSGEEDQEEEELSDEAISEDGVENSEVSGSEDLESDGSESNGSVSDDSSEEYEVDEKESEAAGDAIRFGISGEDIYDSGDSESGSDGSEESEESEVSDSEVSDDEELADRAQEPDELDANDSGLVLNTDELEEPRAQRPQVLREPTNGSAKKEDEDGLQYMFNVDMDLLDQHQRRELFARLPSRNPLEGSQGDFEPFLYRMDEPSMYSDDGCDDRDFVSAEVQKSASSNYSKLESKIVKLLKGEEMLEEDVFSDSNSNDSEFFPNYPSSETDKPDETNETDETDETSTKTIKREKFFVHGREADELDYVIRDYREMLVQKQKAKEEEAALRASVEGFVAELAELKGSYMDELDVETEELLGAEPEAEPKELLGAAEPEPEGDAQDAHAPKNNNMTFAEHFRSFMDRVHADNQKRNQQLLKLFKTREQ